MPNLDEYARDVERLLSNCAVGQPYDEGVVWLNPHAQLNEVMEKADVPTRFRRKVARLVYCPSCGDHHNLHDEVGIKSDGELRFEDLCIQWEESLATRFEEFYSFLAKYPYLGAAHKFGAELRETVKTFPCSEIQNEEWFRGRRIKSGKTLTSYDFDPPDPTKQSIQEGRYNHFGQAVFYLAKNSHGAAIEVADEHDTMAWVQKFRICKIPQIMDLSCNEKWADDAIPAIAVGLSYSGALIQLVDRSQGWKPEYFVSRYIADCAREQGFNGILVRSARHFSENLVLFSWNAEMVEPSGNPEIIRINPAFSHTPFPESVEETEIPFNSIPSG